MAQAVYFDHNCLAYLLGQPVLNGAGWTDTGTTALRAELRHAVAGGQIVVLGSEFHLEEASRIPDDAARRRFLDFFWDTVKWWLLMPTRDLTRAEAAVRRPLEGNEPFEDYCRRRLLRHLSLTRRSIGPETEAWVARQRAATLERKERLEGRLIEAFADRAPEESTRRWWNGGETAMIRDWVHDYIASNTEHLGLGPDARTWPRPEELQTAWAMTAYLLARVYLNVGLKRRIGDGDAHDAHHYASACYGDVLVTEDAAFRETIAEVPENPITVLAFGDFAAQLAIDPH